MNSITATKLHPTVRRRWNDKRAEKHAANDAVKREWSEGRMMPIASSEARRAMRYCTDPVIDVEDLEQVALVAMVGSQQKICFADNPGALARVVARCAITTELRATKAFIERDRSLPPAYGMERRCKHCGASVACGLDDPCASCGTNGGLEDAFSWEFDVTIPEEYVGLVHRVTATAV